MCAVYKCVLTDTTTEIMGIKKHELIIEAAPNSILMSSFQQNIEILTSHSNRTDQRNIIRIRRTSSKVSDFQMNYQVTEKKNMNQYFVSTYHANRDQQSDPETISTLQNSGVYFGWERLQKTCRFQLY